MAQLLVRDIKDDVVKRLKNRARKDGRSLESEARIILEQAVAINIEDARKLADKIRNRSSKRKLDDSAELIQEDRER
jgi:plasmid stability protein